MPEEFVPARETGRFGFIALRRKASTLGWWAFAGAALLMWVLDATLPSAELWLAPLAADALVYVLVAWAPVFAILLLVYLSVSLDDFRVVAAAAAVNSAPAMWFAPAILLLASGTPLGTPVGLALVANAVRLLVSRRAPHGVAPAPGARKRRPRAILFRYTAGGAVLSGEGVSPMMGAFAVQAGIAAALLGYPILSAVLLGITAALWTRSSLRRGAYQPHAGPNGPHVLLSIVLTLLLALPIAVGRLSADAGFKNPDRSLDVARQAWSRLIRPQDERHPATRSETPERSGYKRSVPSIQLTGLVPGVILRPEAKPARGPRLVSPFRPRTMGLPTAAPLAFEFGGEYHLFPVSSGGVDKDAAVYPGTPLDAVYASASGTPLATEAYQRLIPPVDLHNVGSVEVVVLSREDSPGAASVQFETTDGGVVDLGGLMFGERPGHEQALMFPVRPFSPGTMASGIRVAFHSGPKRDFMSVRVAVSRVRLVPRGG